MHSIDLNVAEFVAGSKPFSIDISDDEDGSMNGRSHSWKEQRLSGSDVDSEDERASSKYRDRKEDSSSAAW